MVDTVSVITLNVSGVNAPIKTQRLSEWIKTQDPITRYLQETHFNYKDIYGLKVNGMGASLVAQWLRIRLPMQGTWVRVLVWEDPTCHGATKPVRHNC